MKNKKFLNLMLLFVIISSVLLSVNLTVGEGNNVADALINNSIRYGSIGYSATVIGKSEQEVINYSTKTVTNEAVNPSYPDCYNLNNALQNYCANVGGVNIINRFYDELIPDYISGFMRKNNYIYYDMPVNSEKKQAVIDTLYQYMRTEATSGTTQEWYKKGLQRYVNEKGRQISFTSILSNNQFDLNKFSAQIKLGRPVTLYVTNFNITSVVNYDNETTLYKSIFDGSHIMIAYGYQKVDYYNENGGLITSKIYLKVSTGISMASGVYVVNNNGSLNDAEAVLIY